MIRTKVSGDFELVVYSLHRQHWANDILKLSWSIRKILQSPSCCVLSLKAYSFDHDDVVSYLTLCLVLTVFFSYIYSMYLIFIIQCSEIYFLSEKTWNFSRKWQHRQKILVCIGKRKQATKSKKFTMIHRWIDL